MLPLQVLSERRPLQLTSIVVGTALRTTTSRRGIDPGQSWLDQIRSVPEITRTTTVFDETANVQAGWVPPSCSLIMILPPAAAFLVTGVNATWSARQAPVGTASGVALAFGVPLAVGDLVSTGPACRLAFRLGGEIWLCVAAVVALVGGADAPPPSSLPIPNTKANATSSSTPRRAQ